MCPAAERVKGRQRGRGRQLSVYITPEQVAVLSRLAEQDERSLSFLIRQAVAEFLERQAVAV